MPTDPDLTIIIVSWNTRQLLMDCLQSVFAGLDRIRAEVVVVDNGSTDGSARAVTERYPQVELVVNDINRGFAVANNQALRRTRGRYVLLLNSDTVIQGDVLAASVAYADRHPEVGVLGCRLLNADGTMQTASYRYPTLRRIAGVAAGLHRLPLTRPWFEWVPAERAQDVDVIPGCYLLARRAAIEQVGLLDEDFFFYAEETDWCARFRKAGWAVRFAPIGRIVHYGGASAVRHGGRRRMLGAALVRLHRKHHGRVAALLVWCVVGFINATRAAGWLAIATCRRDEESVRRARESVMAGAAHRPDAPTP